MKHREPPFGECSIYLCISKTAFDPRPFCQTGTLGHFFVRIRAYLTYWHRRSSSTSSIHKTTYHILTPFSIARSPNLSNFPGVAADMTATSIPTELLSASLPFSTAASDALPIGRESMRWGKWNNILFLLICQKNVCMARFPVEPKNVPWKRETNYDFRFL